MILQLDGFGFRGGDAAVFVTKDTPLTLSQRPMVNDYSVVHLNVCGHPMEACFSDPDEAGRVYDDLAGQLREAGLQLLENPLRHEWERGAINVVDGATVEIVPPDEEYDHEEWRVMLRIGKVTCNAHTDNKSGAREIYDETVNMLEAIDD